jgi:hypothetical protein
MRAVLPVLVLSALVGCAPACPEPSSVDGTWEVFATVLTSEGADDPDFPSYHSPANGPSTWTLAWGPSEVGPVDLLIDGVPVEASGTWSRDRCGAFSLRVAGDLDGPTGSRHTFDADAELVVFGDRLEGTWDWSELWVARDGLTTGSFTADGQVEGVR